MKPTDATLTEQLRLTGNEIRLRQELLHFSSEDKDALLEARPIIAKNVDDLVEEFYAEQVETDEVSRLIGDSESLFRLKKHMRKYILDLFEGDYDGEYVQSRLRIGLVHKRIGVTPKLYISAISNLMKRIKTALIDQKKADCVKCNHRIDAFNKLIFFDLELVFDTYIQGLTDELEHGKDEVTSYAESLEQEVAQRTRELHQLARTDGLTKLLNQRSFYEELRRELSRSQRMEESLSLIYLDLDGFKAVNDQQGHRRGDEILLTTADIVRSVIREEDIAARYGGDEFCIILPHTVSDSAQIVAQRLVEAAKIKLAETGVTISIGIAVKESKMIIDANTLVKKADEAMYRSKEKTGYSINIIELDDALKSP